MFWLFENNFTKINFIQIFSNYTKYKDCGAGCINLFYNFSSDSVINDVENKEFNLNTIKPTTINYTVKIKDSFIQYSNDTSILTFQIENEFIKETDESNIFKNPYFKWKYTKSDNHKLPNISTKNYDFYYKNVNFVIYKINNNKLFIIETIDDICKKYILEKNNLS